MRAALRLLANVKPARYLEAGNPTGLTGLYTHSSPRSTLLSVYSQTLDKLNNFPESSLYRQSTEALTKHRMAIVEAAEPPGLKEWQEKASKILKESPETIADLRGGRARVEDINGSVFLHRSDPQDKDIRYTEWNGESDEGDGREGMRGEEDRTARDLFGSRPDEKSSEVPRAVWEAEPQMTADQVEEIENKIGAGLIEEVVQMAESELKLVDIMYQAKVWESLEEKPAEGQWEYFERKVTN
ncbi:ETC complex I subunit conserved region-domain-containing protein [Xylariaceae sp. FL1019]|nr:ETC complex I subunit conserved region-domain-containing protein [Xylariaceae sp. FL1019]